MNTGKSGGVSIVQYVMMIIRSLVGFDDLHLNSGGGWALCKTKCSKITALINSTVPKEMLDSQY